MTDISLGTGVVGDLMVEPVKPNGVCISSLSTEEYIYIPQEEWEALKDTVELGLKYYD